MDGTPAPEKVGANEIVAEIDTQGAAAGSTNKLATNGEDLAETRKPGETEGSKPYNLRAKKEQTQPLA